MSKIGLTIEQQAGLASRVEEFKNALDDLEAAKANLLRTEETLIKEAQDLGILQDQPIRFISASRVVEIVPTHEAATKKFEAKILETIEVYKVPT